MFLFPPLILIHYPFVSNAMSNLGCWDSIPPFYVSSSYRVFVFSLILIPSSSLFKCHVKSRLVGKMECEMLAFEHNEIWKLVPLSPRKKVVICQVDIYGQLHCDGSLAHLKVCSISKGYS